MPLTERQEQSVATAVKDAMALFPHSLNDDQVMDLASLIRDRLIVAL